MRTPDKYLCNIGKFEIYETPNFPQAYQVRWQGAVVAQFRRPEDVLEFRQPRYYIQYNVGKAKYVVNHHDGIKKHGDGSNFYDVTIFKNKKKLTKFIDDLCNNGYIERR